MSFWEHKEERAVWKWIFISLERGLLRFPERTEEILYCWTFLWNTTFFIYFSFFFTCRALKSKARIKQIFTERSRNVLVITLTAYFITRNVCGISTKIKRNFGKIEDIWNVSEINQKNKTKCIKIPLVLEKENILSVLKIQMDALFICSLVTALAFFYLSEYMLAREISLFWFFFFFQGFEFQLPLYHWCILI